MDGVGVKWEFENLNYICWQVNEVNDIIDFERKFMIEESRRLSVTCYGRVLGFGFND